MSTDRHLEAPVRAWTGLVLGAVGAVLLWLGWYEVAGETLVAKQLPFVASASIPGAALVVAGAVLIAGENSRRGSDQAEAMVGALYELLTEPAAADAAAPPGDADSTVVAVPGGTRYHPARLSARAGQGRRAGRDQDRRRGSGDAAVPRVRRRALRLRPLVHARRHGAAIPGRGAS